MKHFVLISFILLTALANGQVLDVFNYSGALSANGWSTHSGTAGQFTTLTTASDLGNSLSYPGLPTSVGNRTTLVGGNSEDINKALTGITGTGYVSFLLKVTNTTGLTTAGEYFTGFGATAGTNVTILGARTFIKAGATAGTFQLGIQNTTGGTPTQTYDIERAVGTTYLVVIKYNTTTSPTQASLFVNPVLGGAEPAATVSNNSGTATFAALASLFFRQAGSAGSGTGNLQIDEIRAGSTWASVTPSSCGTSSTLNVTNCGPYTLNGTQYTTSGTYTQLLANGNAAGCDSTITLHLTVNSPSASTITTSSCGTYTLNGTPYTTSGTYTQTLPNAAGCDSTITLNLSIVSSITYYQDLDGDGFGNAAMDSVACAVPTGYVTNNTDCNDNNNTIGAPTTVYYADADGDGFGNAAVDSLACSQPTGYVTNNTDCNDSNNAIGSATMYYADADGDGYGNAAMDSLACSVPVGYVLSNTDCNDANPAVHPGATEIPNNGIDEDCSGADLNTLGAQLAIYEFTGPNTCPTPMVSVTAQPANATFSDYTNAGATCAGAANVFNNSEWNTGTTVDETEYNQFTVKPANCYELSLTKLNFKHRTSGSGGSPFVHVRSSLDNFTTDLATPQLTVVNTDVPVQVILPAAFASITDSVTFRFYVTEIASTGATYRNDEVSVTGFINALTPAVYYADMDGDGFGDATADSTACVQPQGFVLDNTDCDDDDAAVNPNTTWYQDSDGDGFGNAAMDSVACVQPVGYVLDNTDCNDANVNETGAVTYYEDNDTDGLGNPLVTMVSCSVPAGFVTNDDDCDDDDNTIGVATNVYYADADGDGFGNAAVTTVACDLPAGYAANDDDCDDTDNTIGAATVEYFEDNDGDGFGDAASSMVACTQPQGYVTNDDDCDDANAAIHPNATDVNGNGIDENCDGTDGYLGIDEHALSLLSLFPNPGTDKVTVSLTGAWNEQTTVRVFGMDGKELPVSPALVATGTIELTTAHLTTGVYLVRVTDGTKTATVRWVKK